MKKLGVFAGGLFFLLVGRTANAGFGNCNFCTFHVSESGGMLTLSGTPTISIPITSMDWYTATLTTNMGQSIQIYPTFGQPMDGMQVPNMLPETTAASITWVIKPSAIAHTVSYVTPLTPN